ncbi:MAG: response regulator transcription factor [Chitinophagaceae bacterium]|nr:response regulator transcription factor [Chitinophagaceae bacterium]
MKKSLTVLCFDDNKNFCDSVCLLLSTTENINVAEAYASYDGMSENISMLKPDVVLMDIDIPPVSGIEAVKIIRKDFPELPVLMLTGFEDDEKVFSSLCAGANGYILKNSKMEALIHQIEEVYAGGSPMTPVIARKVLNQFARLQPSNSTKEEFNLSSREKEVLQLLVTGKSYKMIAGELCISYETVHSRIRRIYEKLQVNSIGEAVSKTIIQKILK